MDIGTYGVAVMTAAAATILFAIIVLPRLVIRRLPGRAATSITDPKDRLSLENDRLKLRNDFRTSCIQLLAGVGLIAGVIVTFNQAQESQRAVAQSLDTARRQLAVAQTSADRQEYSDAIKQLGDPVMEVRVAAVDRLADFADIGSDTRRGEIGDLLSAFVREHSPWPPAQGQEPADADPTTVRPLYIRSYDVATAIFRLNHGNLANTSAVLSGDLRHADFRGSYRGAFFYQAHLGGSNFSEADLRGANLSGADLTSTHFDGAKLCGVDMAGSILSEASFEGAVIDNHTTWPAEFDAATAGVMTAADSTQCSK